MKIAQLHQQWQIQDFPDGSANLLFWQFFPEIANDMNVIILIKNYWSLFISVKVTTTGTTVPSTIRTKPTKGCGGKPADVVFALDSSSSIWGPDFDTQLRFIQDIVGVFDISPETTHVGLLTFGSVPENHFQLDKFNTEEDVSTWITLSGSGKANTFQKY